MRREEVGHAQQPPINKIGSDVERAIGEGCGGQENVRG